MTMNKHIDEKDFGPEFRKSQAGMQVPEGYFDSKSIALKSIAKQDEKHPKGRLRTLQFVISAIAASVLVIIGISTLNKIEESAFANEQELANYLIEDGWLDDDELVWDMAIQSEIANTTEYQPDAVIEELLHYQEEMNEYYY